MSERDEYIPGVPCWVDASYQDPESVLPFYSGLFGWEFMPVMASPDERFFIATINGGSAAGIGELPAGHPAVPAWNTYIAVTNADDAVAKAQAAGGEVVAPAFDIGEAGRMAILKDPQGAVFCVWQAGQMKGAKIVNEHGAVNFNTLHTNDLDAARRFYGEVFGWTTLSLAGMEFWTLPGYGDYLEILTPGIRAGAAEMGAAGFEDVVAVLDSVSGDEQPHWHVTFAVNDADAAAADATRLGGSVLVAPLDAPYVRLTVLADPTGTPFTASQFVAENR